MRFRLLFPGRLCDPLSLELFPVKRSMLERTLVARGFPVTIH